MNPFLEFEEVCRVNAAVEALKEVSASSVNKHVVKLFDMHVPKGRRRAAVEHADTRVSVRFAVESAQGFLGSIIDKIIKFFKDVFKWISNLFKSDSGDKLKTAQDNAKQAAKVKNPRPSITEAEAKEIGKCGIYYESNVQYMAFAKTEVTKYFGFEFKKSDFITAFNKANNDANEIHRAMLDLLMSSPFLAYPDMAVETWNHFFENKLEPLCDRALLIPNTKSDYVLKADKSGDLYTMSFEAVPSKQKESNSTFFKQLYTEDEVSRTIFRAWTNINDLPARFQSEMDGGALVKSIERSKREQKAIDQRLPMVFKAQGDCLRALGLLVKTCQDDSLKALTEITSVKYIN